MNELDASSLLAIVSHLQKPSDLLHAAQASTALASVCKAQSLWQRLLEEKFDLIISAAPSASPFQAPAQAAGQHHAAAATAAAPTGHAGPAEDTTAAGAVTTTATAAAPAGFSGPAQDTTAGAAGSSTHRPLDLQETFRALSTAPPAGALRFAAVFTDGGCDGMQAGDLTYWADHALQPNHWSPHCSDGQSNINIIGLLHQHGMEEDDRLARHRSYLVDRCAAAAAALFSPPSAPQQTREEAAASLTSWSTSGLERLFTDLYQDLWLHQQDSTWGRLLLSGVQEQQWPAELERLAATADTINNNSRHRTYKGVERVPQHEIQAAAAAEAAGGSSRQERLQAGGQAAAVGFSRVQPAAAAATTVEEGGQAGADALRKMQQRQDGVGTAAVAAVQPGSRQEQEQQQQQSMQRHMVDTQLLPWLSTPARTQCTALVEEVVVSRIGHFTCPVAAGAVLLGQHPCIHSRSSSSGGCGGSDGSSEGSQELQAVLRVKHDPLVTALDNCSSYEQVLQAVASGVLPALVQYEQRPGVEWCEFAPLGRQQRLQRQQQGWYMRPLVWFRFSTPQPDPEQAAAAAEAAAAAAENAAIADAAEDAAVAIAAGDAAAALVAADAEGGDSTESYDSDADAASDGGEMTSDDVLDDAITFFMELPAGSSGPAAAAAAGSSGPAAAAAAAEAAAAGGYEGGFFDAGSPTGPTPAVMQYTAGTTAGGTATAAAAAAAPTQQHHHQHQHQQQQQQQEASGALLSSSSSSRHHPWQQRGTPGVSVLPAPASLQEVDHSKGEPHMLLRIPLAVAPRSGNVLLLKLISCEDKMAEYDDPYDEPNIDVQYVALRGVGVSLAPGSGLAVL